ncbi:hypothetical protein HGRIS_001404 [Hohenbuehelia grisea]|uniref:Uncharacterized protein n=1 Tax=Hohenbuehelia grisea TaxID=104357 RepID=A0ABR3IPF3_9AGAR
MGIPAGGSLTADQWLITATVSFPIAIPQIWSEYCTEDPETVRLRRIGEMQKAIQRKKDAQAAARRAREAAAAAEQPTRRSKRKRKQTERSLFVCPEQHQHGSYDVP